MKWGVSTDAPTTAPGWVRPYLPRGATKRVTPGMTPCPADSSCHDDAAIIGLTVNTSECRTVSHACYITSSDLGYLQSCLNSPHIIYYNIVSWGPLH